MRIAIVTAAVVAAASTARADERRDVIATQPLALVARGVSLSYERPVLPGWSAVALTGVRGAAGGDYSSRTWTVGAELRWWPRRPMRGLHLAAHASAAHTSLTDDVMDTHVGDAWALTQRLDVGYRWWTWRRLTLTPSLGVALREDVDRSGRLATTARPAVVIGLELGWRL